MRTGYEVWMGHPVILRVVTGDLRVPLRGTVVSETSDALKLRVGGSWDIDIFKSMVIGIEEDNPVMVLN